MILLLVNTIHRSWSYCDNKLEQSKFCSGDNRCVKIKENICKITRSKDLIKNPITHKHQVEFCRGNLNSTLEESVGLCGESKNELAT